MNASERLESYDEIARMLRRVRTKGVMLWSENGVLRYRAPKGALTRDEIQQLRACGSSIAAFLDVRAQVRGEPARFESRTDRARAPLTFSQMAYWNAHRLHERPSLRHLVSAVRLRGRFDAHLFRRILDQVVERHEALRTRIRVADAEPIQEISPSGTCPLRLDDLSAEPENIRDLEISRMIEALILEPVDVTTGPLVAARLVHLSDEEHVLMVAMDHMISDAVSVNIFVRDLLMGYEQARRGDAVRLPEMPVQFADYAVWQRKAHRLWLARHGTYWTERLKGCGRLKWPADGASPGAKERAWGIASVKLERNLKCELTDWSRARRTTLVMSLFTAYVALVLRWCNESEAVIRYQTDGRMHAGVSNTIGYFASVLHLRVAVAGTDSILDLLHRVTNEYCAAYEHADFSYLDAQNPPPEFTRNPAFNFVSQEPKREMPGSNGSDGALLVEPVPFTNPVHRQYEKDAEPVLLLYDTDEGIVGGVYYPSRRFSDRTMTAFAANLLALVGAMLKDPNLRVSEVQLL